MAITVLVNGAKGKMGQEVVRAVEADAGLRLVGKIDIEDRLEEVLARERPQVVVDFTHPSVAVRNTEAILRAGARPVVGTTGFRPEDITRLQALARDLELGGLLAPNFAIGAVLLMRFAAEAARFLPDVEIIEFHHRDKADAPSGTAVKTAELIAERVGGDESLSQGRSGSGSAKTHPSGGETIPGVRGGRCHGIPIHSLRLPGLVAHQEVILGGLGQTLTIRHDSIARTSFMPGVVLAVKKAPELKELLYGLEKILGL